MSPSTRVTGPTPWLASEKGVWARLGVGRVLPPTLHTAAVAGILITAVGAAGIIVGESRSPGDTAGTVSFWLWDWAVPSYVGIAQYKHVMALIEAFAILLLGTRWALKVSRSRAKNWITGMLLIACLVASGTLAGAKNAAFRPQAFDVRDDFHYLLGTKYFDELGYVNLYECAMVSELATGQNQVKWVRDLRTNGTFDIKYLARDVPRHRRCIARFSPERWEAFRSDVSQFAAWLKPWGNQWKRVMMDHGYNGPPTLTALLSAVGNMVTIDHQSLSLLGCINLAAVMLMLCAALWAFGWEAAVAFGVTFFCSSVEGFGHAMSIPRYLWLVSLVIGVCMIKKERYGYAGALLTLSTCLKVFPIFFLAAGLLHVLVRLGERGHLRELHRWKPGRFVSCGALTAAILGVLSLILHRGVDGWIGFFGQMALNGNRTAGGCIGFVFNFAYPSTNPDFDRMMASLDAEIFGVRVQQISLGLALLIAFLVVRHVKRMSGQTTAVLALGFTLMHLFAVPMRYYYAGYFGLALLFAAEGHKTAWRWAVCYLLALDILAKVLSGHASETFLMTGIMSSGFTVYVIGLVLYLEHDRLNTELDTDPSRLRDRACRPED
ncbi:MAG: hypothetical protein V3V08_20150 [Nannocystaceae bacterium]